FSAAHARTGSQRPGSMAWHPEPPQGYPICGRSQRGRLGAETAARVRGADRGSVGGINDDVGIQTIQEIVCNRRSTGARDAIFPTIAISQSVQTYLFSTEEYSASDDSMALCC